MRVKYVGSTPTSFVSIGREVFPGDEFSIPESEFPAYVSRSDIVEVEDPEPVQEKPSRARRAVAEENAAVDQPVSTEESSADAESEAS